MIGAQEAPCTLEDGREELGEETPLGAREDDPKSLQLLPT